MTLNYYSPSGAKEIIFIYFFIRSSRATGPNIRVPIGSPCAFTNTHAFLSNFICDPSCLRRPFLVLTITALTTSPFLTEALGIASLTGSIEIGKYADLIAINLDELNSQPSFDPISDIVYSVASNQVSHHWINGKILLQNGTLLNLNTKDIIRKAQHWASKIKGKTN